MSTALLKGLRRRRITAPIERLWRSSVIAFAAVLAASVHDGATALAQVTLPGSAQFQDLPPGRWLPVVAEMGGRVLLPKGAELRRGVTRPDTGRNRAQTAESETPPWLPQVEGSIQSDHGVPKQCGTSHAIGPSESSSPCAASPCRPAPLSPSNCKQASRICRRANGYLSPESKAGRGLLVRNEACGKGVPRSDAERAKRDRANQPGTPRA